MDRNEYRQFLLDNLYGAKIESGGDQITCKCKYCPDKIDHYHMSISIPKTDNDYSFFNCWLCHSSGIVSYKRLIEWGIYDQEWNAKLNKHNNSISKSNINYNYTLDIYNTVTGNIDTEYNKAKLDYISNRLGLEFTIYDCDESKIVLNLVDCLRSNNITNLTRDARIVKALSDYFIGFISTDGNFITLRRIIDKGYLYKNIDRSYIIYNIYNKIDNTLKFINIPSLIDISRRVYVHLAEGPFDMLSIRYNLRGYIDNGIFGAATGNTYKAFIKYLITSLGIIDMELHLYLDNDDAGHYALSDLINELGLFRFPIYIHYNLLGKDMGTSLNNIKESIERIS